MVIPGSNLIVYNYFIAPEIQHKSLGSKSSDLYSLGMLMVALFNGGQSLIQANYSTNLYFKQAGVVSNFIMMHIYFNIYLILCINTNPWKNYLITYYDSWVDDMREIS